MNYLALLEAIIASAVIEKDEDFFNSEIFIYYIKTLPRTMQDKLKKLSCSK